MKKKIILLLIFVFCLISLVGISFAYFQTKTSGNTSSKITKLIGQKISIDYSGGTNELVSNQDSYFIPGSILTKTFNITNTGNKTLTYSIMLDNVVNTYTRTNDITYELKRGSTIIDSGTFPIYSKVLVLSESINKDSTYNYTLTITYNNSNENQIVDNGKKLNAEVVIDESTTKNTLSYEIITNAFNVKNNANATTLEQTNHYAVYRESPTTTVAESINNENEASLSKTEDYDADGTQNGYSLYFRGNVENNYVTFAGMCWRVVRIDGSGNVKIILEDQDEECSSTMTGNWDIPITTGTSTKTGNFGYDSSTYSGKYIANYLNPVTNANSAQVTVFKNFQTGVLSSYLDKLVSGNWCYDDLAYTSSNGGTVIEDKSSYYTNGTRFYYDSYVRLYEKSTKEPTLKCNGTILNKYSDNTDMYVATLTADEIVYAGGKVYTSNQNYYLLNNWQKSNSKYFWSLSPDYFNGNLDVAFVVSYDGYVYSYSVDNYFSFRPTVSLKSGTVITGGDGTIDNAYVVN